ncbi:MAG: chaplin family protein [Actinocrinis sp.]
MAKRSLAFTVATGGLLLTGTGYAPAQAAVGFGALPGPAAAQGNADQASPSGVSTPISVAPEARPQVAAPKVLTPKAPQDPAAGGGSSASSSVSHSGGILSGNTVQIPIDLGLNLCGNQADAAAVANHVYGSTCGGTDAAGGSNSGSSATSTTDHSGGILSGNTVQAPINIPLNVCGNQAVAVGAKNVTHGSTCGTGGGPGSNAGNGGGSSATAVTDHSGGLLSGNTVQAPVNVPLNACGNQANVIALKDKVSGTDCTTGGPGNGQAASSATAVTVNSGGIGSGMILQTPINVPVNACGNQATVIGALNRVGGVTCSTGSDSTSATAATINSGGILSGTSGQVPINVPVEACGNQAGVIAVKNVTGGAVCAGPTPPSSTTVSLVTNSGGILSGNQPAVPINVPVNVCGNQATVVGIDNVTGAVECGSPMTPPTTPPTTPPPSGTPTPSTSTSTSASATPSPTSSNTTCPVCGTPTPSTSTSTSSSPSPSNCPACGTSSPSPTAMTPPPNTPSAPPNGPHGPTPPSGSLAGTGAEEGMALAVGGAVLLAGVGLRVASKRRSR